MVLAHHATSEAAAVATSSSMSALHVVEESGILQSSEFWSVVVMLSLIGLFFTWETFVETMREKLPKTLMPVVDSMLAEMGGLGFIGLFLSVAVTGNGPLGILIGQVSEEWLGNEEVLLETFEFLHTAFFEVGIAFFAISGLMVASVLGQIQSLAEVSKLATLDINGDGDVDLNELAEALEAPTIQVDLDGDGDLDDEEIRAALASISPPTWQQEAVMSTNQVMAEALVVRERMMELAIDKDIMTPEEAKDNFRIENYCEVIIGRDLKEFVELSPLVWLPLVPFLSLGHSVDASRDIVSAASENALESCGCFLESPTFMASVAVCSTISLAWGAFNFWKMYAVKQMLLPTLCRDESSELHEDTQKHEVVLLPPRYEDPVFLKAFNSSPGPVSWIESIWRKEPICDQERLFGTIGRKGPSFYRNSQKFHAWFLVSQIVFWGSQIVARDAVALMHPADRVVGNPDLVMPELGLFSLFLLLDIGLLCLAPRTFLNYSLVSSIEQLAEEDVLREACQGDECVLPSDFLSDAVTTPSSVRA